MAPRLKRPMYHAAPKGPTNGMDVKIAKFAARRYETGVMPPAPPGGDTKHFGSALYEALHKTIQPREGIPASGDIGQATWDVLWPLLDDYHRWQYRVWKVPVIPKPDPVPKLGPIYLGGISLLLHSCTHNTDGFPNPAHPVEYPAFDDGWIAGRTVIAPERLKITEQSGSQGGDAFFAEGESKLRYWIGHVVAAPATGRWFDKGEKLDTIAYMPAYLGSSHVHCGIDARPLIGHSLLYGRDGHGPDYTYGAPSIGAQLAEALSFAP